MPETHEVCGAKTRAGTPCQEPPCPGKRRCRIHGGAPGSGAPSKERNGNWKGGAYSRVLHQERSKEEFRRYREWQKQMPKGNRIVNVETDDEA